MIEQDFYDQLGVSKAGKEYLALIESCKSKALIPEQGYEIHHIFPTSLGGLNINDNKVKLTVFDHCKAHALLAQAIPCYKTLQPLVKMSSGQVQKLEDLEKITLYSLYNWAELREKALHHPKSPEHIEKNRQGYLGKKMTPEHIAKRTATRKGTITVTDGLTTKYIKKEELQQYLDLGWHQGISNIRRQKLVESHLGKTGDLSPTTGRKCISKGGKELKVKVEDIDKYLSEGWKLGRTSEFKEQHSKAMEGKTNLGKIRINKDGIGKIIRKEDLQKYLDLGWVKGRSFKQHIYIK